MKQGRIVSGETYARTLRSGVVSLRYVDEIKKVGSGKALVNYVNLESGKEHVIFLASFARWAERLSAYDIYAQCEKKNKCTHALDPGVLVSDLFSGDNPVGTVWVKRHMTRTFAEEESFRRAVRSSRMH